MSEALYQSLLILFIILYSLLVVTGQKDTGHMASMWVASALVYGLIVAIVNVKIHMISYSHYWFSLLGIIISIGSYVTILYILYEKTPINFLLDNYDSKGAFTEMMNNPNTYLAGFVVIYSSFFLWPMFRAVKDLYRVCKKKNDVHQRLEESKISDENEEIIDLEPPEMLLPEEYETAQQTLYQFTKKHTGFAFSSEGHISLDPNIYNR